MPKLIARIDGVFAIDGRGTVIAMPLEDEWQLPADEKIYRRERIRLVPREKEPIETYIKDIEFINRGKERGGLAFLLPRDVESSDVEDGSELWLLRDGSEPDLQP